MASPEPTTKTRARTAWDVLSLVLVATASTAVGFFAVIHAAGPERLRQGTWLTQAEERAAPDAGDERDASPVETTAHDGGAGTAAEAPHEVGGVPIQPAPRLKLGGEPFYWRCWDTGAASPLHEGECDRMRPFERLIASRLGEVARCYERLDRPDATGVLSLAVEVDFGPTPPANAPVKTPAKAPAKAPASDAGQAGSMRFWSSQSTTLEGAEAIINCLRRDLDEIPLDGISHRRQKYTIFFPIEFMGTADDQGGTPVELVLDKVRLRETPENGKIVARLRKGEPVRVLEVREGWARVKTADAQEGWLYVDAIKLAED